jgi:hypothetical protein
MIEQSLINWVLAGFGGLVGFMLRVVWRSVQDLQSADKELTAKVASIEILVAGDYVKKDEVLMMTNTIFSKLDRIEDKLDKKADK